MSESLPAVRTKRLHYISNFSVTFECFSNLAILRISKLYRWQRCEKQKLRCIAPDSKRLQKRLEITERQIEINE